MNPHSAWFKFCRKEAVFPTHDGWCVRAAPSEDGDTLCFVRVFVDRHPRESEKDPRRVVAFRSGLTLEWQRLDGWWDPKNAKTLHALWLEAPYNVERWIEVLVALTGEEAIEAGRRVSQHSPLRSLMERWGGVCANHVGFELPLSPDASTLRLDAICLNSVSLQSDRFPPGIIALRFVENAYRIRMVCDGLPLHLVPASDGWLVFDDSELTDRYRCAIRASYGVNVRGAVPIHAVDVIRFEMQTPDSDVWSPIRPVPVLDVVCLQVSDRNLGQRRFPCPIDVPSLRTF